MEDIETRGASDRDEAVAPRSGLVALVGSPNVGKSTLMNRVLGVKLAIATPKPQTTRNRILGVWHAERGQIAFVDTPGVHQTEKRLNKALVAAALGALEEVDAICHIVDNRPAPEPGQAWTDAALRARLAEAQVPVVLALNKIDAFKNAHVMLPALERASGELDYAHVVPVSAKTGENVDELLDVLLGLLPAAEPIFPPEVITDQAERFLAAEFIREQLMEQTEKELPYAVAVEIESFTEARGKDLLRIEAVIHVERESQKGIVIGKKGARLKAVGEGARRQMEAFFGRKVFLKTFVRVEPNWSERERSLRRFGYEP